MAFAYAYVLLATFPFWGALICHPTVALDSSCTVGDDSDSSRFGKEMVFGLFPNGRSSTDLGDFGSITQTARPFPGTNAVYSRPFAGASLGTTVETMPKENLVTFTSATTVTRTTGVHEGTLRITADDPIRTFAYGSNTTSLTFGAMGTIPRDYLGQEYFVMVRSDPGLGQVVISSTGQPTFVRLTPNAAFKFDGILYDGEKELDIELPAWGQAAITTSSNYFTGSRILANHSVAVVSGAACAYSNDAVDGPCDYAIEQLVPYDRWGTVFNLAPFNGGASPGYFVQVVAGRDGTRVVINGTGVNLNQGETFDKDILTGAILRITSDKPVQVMKYMKGAISMVLVTPEEQYINHTTYIRMNTVAGHAFTHYFTIVIPCAESSGLDIVHEKFGTSEASLSLGSSSSWDNDGICAFSITGMEDHTYTITHLDSRSKFFVEVYGRSSSASFAYVGNQKYERLRCVDYNYLLYGTSTGKTSTLASQTSMPARTETLLTTPAEPTISGFISTNPTTGDYFPAGATSPLIIATLQTQSLTQSEKPTTASITTTSATTTSTATTTATVAALNPLTAMPTTSSTISTPPPTTTSIVTTPSLTSPNPTPTAIAASNSSPSTKGTSISPLTTIQLPVTKKLETTATFHTPESEITSSPEATNTYNNPGTSNPLTTYASPTRISSEGLFPMNTYGIGTGGAETITRTSTNQPSNLATTPSTVTTTSTIFSAVTQLQMKPTPSAKTTDPASEYVNASSNVNKRLTKQTLKDSTTTCVTSSTTSKTVMAASSTENISSTSLLSENVNTSFLIISAPRSAMTMCYYLAKLKLEERRSTTSPICAALSKSSSPSALEFGNSAEIGGSEIKQPTQGSARTGKQSSKEENSTYSQVRKNQSYIFPVAIVVFGAGLPTIIACYYLWRKPRQQYEVLCRQRSGSKRRDKVQAVPLSRLVSDL